MDNELRARIEELERRVGVLERATAAETPPAPPVAPPTTPPPRPPTRADAPGALPEFVSRDAARDQAAKPGTVDMTFEEFIATRHMMPEPAQREPRGEATTRATRRTAPDVESLVGGNWFAIAGGFVVLLGLVFFFQFAIREGWVQKISPAMRCGMGGMLGLGLLATGELLKRKLNAWAAVGVSGAGVGALFISTLVAYTGFHLLSPVAAMALIAASAALGIVQSLRLNLIAVAHIALVGAAFAPLMIETPQPNVNPLSAYYLVLLVTGLLLAALRAGTFGSLRWTVSGAVMLTGGACAFQSSAIVWLWALFAGVCGAAIHVETAYSAARRDAHEGLDAEPATDAPRPTLGDRINASPVEGLNLVLLFVVTLWSVTVATLLMNRDATGPQWLPSAAAGVATLIGAFVLAGNATSLREMPSTRKGLIAISELAQTGALLIATVALALSNEVQLIAWLTLGAAAIVAGRSIDWRPLRVFGAVLGLIASGRLLVYEPVFGGLFSGGVVFHGLVLTTWTWLMASAAVLWVLVGLSAKPTLPRRFAGVGIAAGLSGVVHLAAAVLNARVESASLMWYWMALSAALLAARKPLRAMLPEASSLLVAMAAMLAWAVAYVFGGWDESHAPVLMHPGLLGGLLNTALLGAGFWCCRAYAEGTKGRNQLAVVTGMVALGLGLLVTSLEVARSAAILTSDGTMRTAAVSIWWGVVALGLLVGGTVMHSAFARRAGLALLSIATAKAIVMDTREVTAGWRAITVLVLGGLMLGVGVAYARIGKMPRAEKKGEAAADESATQ